MFPFWEIAIAPLIEAAQARKLVEIGALRGETTVKLVSDLGPGAEVHVIDPLPQFDPSEHERAFPGQYIFHRDLSLNVLPDLTAVDVALIDGDHNWYTVYNELRLIREASRRARKPLPVLVLHDVAWPYGFRDLYYEPSQIPEEFRQPHAKAGMHPELKKLNPNGGVNRTLDNALEPGGPRNGVRCGLNDFLAEHDRSYRQVILPIYFGLAIVVDEDRMAAAPDIKRVLDDLESAEGRRKLLQLSERIRIDGVVREHAALRMHNAALAQRADLYLDLLKGALLDEHYLENEVRVEYLASLPAGTAPDPGALRDPARQLPLRYDRLRGQRLAGKAPDERRNVAYFPFTDAGRPQLDRLQQAVEAVTRGRDTGDGVAVVEGDIVECGVGRGGAGVFLRGVLEAHRVDGRTVWAVDSFLATEPGSTPGADVESTVATFRADLNQVRDAYDRFGLLDGSVRFLQGDVAAAAVELPADRLAVLRVGGSVLGPALGPVLRILLPRVAPGGHVVIEGSGTRSVDATVRRVRDELGIADPIEQVDWNVLAWVAGSAVAPADLATSIAASTDRVGVVPPAPEDTCGLTVLVVVYNMRREAQRTLRSLSRTYQVGVEDLDYEVLVLDNGSAPDNALSAEEVASFGPEFRLIEMGADARPSPTFALNRGLAEARGEVVASMIDGAHVVSPGVLGQSVKAIHDHAPAMVAIQQWYVGPGQQGDAQLLGYDQKAEDRLFNRIQWPIDGYRLFEIGHFIGDRDWFDGIVESNCLIVPRSLLEQAGGFDDSFSTPGSGYSNLELFERLGQTPGLTVVSLLGEGSFHQVHGGTTTNIADAEQRRALVSSMGQEFRDLRGRPLDGLRSPILYIGSMATKAARRTRSRRELTLSFDVDRDPVTHDDPTSPEPTFVADELKIGAIEAVWGSQSWKTSTWLGRPVLRYPADLHVYQEIIAAEGPDVVVLVGDDEGLAGRALFVASVLDGLGHGEVVAVGPAGADGATHPRVRAVAGAGDDAEVAARVVELVAGRSAVVVIGLGAHDRIQAAFGHYAPLVPPGGHAIVENTVVNGRPVASSFGPGPHEAVVAILAGNPDFVADPTMERYTLTFNRGGYLKRMAAR